MHYNHFFLVFDIFFFRTLLKYISQNNKLQCVCEIKTDSINTDESSNLNYPVTNYNNRLKEINAIENNTIKVRGFSHATYYMKRFDAELEAIKKEMAQLKGVIE